MKWRVRVWLEIMFQFRNDKNLNSQKLESTLPKFGLAQARPVRLVWAAVRPVWAAGQTGWSRWPIVIKIGSNLTLSLTQLTLSLPHSSLSLPHVHSLSPSLPHRALPLPNPRLQILHPNSISRSRKLQISMGTFFSTCSSPGCLRFSSSSCKKSSF